MSTRSVSETGDASDATFAAIDDKAADRLRRVRVKSKAGDSWCGINTRQLVAKRR